jgi:iron(III) transport system ATP-binding protein
MLQLDSLTKTYPSRESGRPEPALKGVSFTVNEGEFFTLLGPSGCGKTTTLQCIAGLEEPDSGTIAINGRTVFSAADGISVAANRRGLGMVFQSYAIWPHMTVYDNVAFPLVHGGTRRPAADVRKRVINALEMVELGHLASRPAPLLSGGQQQRVALARAMVHEPMLLLLDEPLSNLDARLRDAMRSELRNLVKRLGTTTIFVTHDQVEALGMSDRIVLMEHGLIVQEGSPRDICMRPRNAFVAEFIGQNNLVPGRVREVGGDVLVDSAMGVVRCAAGDGLRAGGEVVLVVHPRAISIAPPGTSASPDDNTYDAVIASQSFLGDQLDVEARVGEHLLHLSLTPFTEVTVGDRVVVSIPVQWCTAVPAAAEPEPRSERP